MHNLIKLFIETEPTIKNFNKRTKPNYYEVHKEGYCKICNRIFKIDYYKDILGRISILTLESNGENFLDTPVENKVDIMIKQDKLKVIKYKDYNGILTNLDFVDDDLVLLEELPF